MPRCRICGREFKISANSGLEICSKDECFKTAWRQMRALFGKASASKPCHRCHKKLSEEDKHRIIEMFDSGISRTAIAEETDIPYSTVARAIQNRSN